MSIGRNRHYVISEIMPRHFIQTADIAGVGTPVMRAIFEQVATNAADAIEEVAEALPPGFPEQLMSSVRAGIIGRSQLLVLDASR
jgi:serine/threonine-protein kinase HipA